MLGRRVPGAVLRPAVQRPAVQVGPITRPVTPTTVSVVAIRRRRTVLQHLCQPIFVVARVALVTKIIVAVLPAPPVDRSLCPDDRAGSPTRIAAYFEAREARDPAVVVIVEGRVVYSRLGVRMRVGFR